MSSAQRLRLLASGAGLAVRGIAVCVAVCALVAGATAQGTGQTAVAATATVPDIVARVNGEPVTRAEWQRTLTDPRTRSLYQREQSTQQVDSQAYGRWVLQRLIVKHLTLQEAARRQFVVSEAELDEAVQAWKASYKGGPKGLQKYLRSRGLDETALRETLRTDMLVARVTSEVIKDVRLTDRQLRAYYEKNKAELQLPEEVLLKVISVKDKAAAEGIVASLRKGEPFENVAREVSTEPRASLLSNGRWIAVNAMPPALREPVAALKAGENTEVLKGGSEYYVVRLEDRRPARAQTLAEAQPQIEQRLLPEKQKEALQAWLRKQEKKAKIEVLVS
jgi:foldase protein PrsA